MRILRNAIVLLVSALLLILAAATILERLQGTTFVSSRIYHAWWFLALWAGLTLLSLAAILRTGLWRRFFVFLLHISLVLVLTGAAVTHFSARDGSLHLRIGESKSSFILKETTARGEQMEAQMPFTLRLDSFSVETYAGTPTPSDFRSFVSVSAGDKAKAERAVISMNHILSRKGFRFFQSSFDQDLRGTILTVSYDRWGTPLTYLGYMLFGLSAICVLLSRNGEFRRLLRHPSLRRGAAIALLLMLPSLSSSAAEIASINRERAAQIGRQQVVYNGRIAPFNTLARDFMKKVYGKTSYRGLTAEQVVVGWGLAPQEWKEQPMILIKDARLRELLGVDGKYARFSQLFADTTYRLSELTGQTDANDKLGKAVRELDEKVGLIIMLTQGELVRPAIGKAKVSEAHITAELLYNRLSLSKWLFMGCLSMGFISFISLLLSHRGKRNGLRSDTSPSRRRFGRGRLVWQVFLWLALLIAAADYALRWYVTGHVPMGNGYETMLFMSLCALAAGCLLARRIQVVVPFAFLISGFTLLVAYIGQMNPQITHLMPVLSSPLLSLHVSVIMLSYALLAFCTLSAIAALLVRGFNKDEARMSMAIEQLTVLSRLMHYPALFLLAAGIFLGSVWAGISWGSYWSWDPKEVWALITLLVYAMPIHRASLPLFRRPMPYHMFMLLAFLAILMTFFGVNYVLGGMHSYA